MSIEVTLTKLNRPWHCLTASDEASSESIQKIGDGRQLAAILHSLSPMTVQQRKLIFALSKVVFEQIGNFPDREAAMDYIKKLARHTRIYYNPLTNVVDENVRSLTELNIDEARQFIDRVTHAIITEVGPQLKAWELIDHVVAMTSRNG